jgi:hypothetical protein
MLLLTSQTANSSDLNPARVIFEKKSLALAGRAQPWPSHVAPQKTNKPRAFIFFQK